ncbi:MAG: alpha/beta hydrolase [Gammaproteobacteria bacterium]|nr:alpha/beta hydrolase [Gammaproteobacteria bacterium]
MAYTEHRYTARDGLSLYFREYGDPQSAATPVLCLAGQFRSARDFDLIAEKLAGERRVICPDLRGRGRSDFDPNWQNYRVSTYFHDITQLLADNDIRRIIMIGTSYGGLLALIFGAFMPLSMAGLVLNDIGPEMRPDQLWGALEYASADRPQPDWNSAAKAIMANMPGTAYQSEALFKTMVRNTYRKGTDGQLHFDWDVNITKPYLGDRAGLIDLWSTYRGLHPVPLLAFRGERSEVLTRDSFLRMGQEYPCARLVTVADTGHAPTLMEPECIAALDEFLRNL